jgi:hypothetical protein
MPRAKMADTKGGKGGTGKEEEKGFTISFDRHLQVRQIPARFFVGAQTC